MDDNEEYMDDCCEICKSFSSPDKIYRSKKGFCLRRKKPVKKSDICAYFKLNVKVEYQIECKASSRQLNITIPSKFRN